jgi:exoribonuclease R
VTAVPSVPTRVLRGVAPPLERRFDAVRARLEVPESFPPEVEAAAEEAAQRGPAAAERVDLRDVPFVTVDPPGSRDLDQALHIERRDGGYRVLYAIADVGAWVSRGSPLEREAWRRGATLYAPDRRTTLYPPALSEGAASLLPDGDRPAVVLALDLDADGVRTAFTATRALVRSRQQLTYAEVDDDAVPLLREVGELLAARAAERGAIQLDAPGQRIEPDGGPAGYRLAWEERLPAEDWNAQISLAANGAVAEALAARRTGIVRAMPPPDDKALLALHRTADALGLPWPETVPLADLLRGLEPGGRRAAFVVAARRALGGASYRALDDSPTPADTHAAVGGLYAHATAPLRRLADRYVLDLLVGEEVAHATLVELAAAMQAADARAARYEHALVDLVESQLLAARVGDAFDAVVLSTEGGAPRIEIADPPVVASLPGVEGLAAGDAVRVRLVEADPEQGRLRFEPA